MKAIPIEDSLKRIQKEMKGRKFEQIHLYAVLPDGEACTLAGPSADSVTSLPFLALISLLKKTVADGDTETYNILMERTVIFLEAMAFAGIALQAQGAKPPAKKKSSRSKEKTQDIEIGGKIIKFPKGGRG